MKKQNCGSVSKSENVKTLTYELKTNNVIFFDRRPLEDMPELYKIAYEMLVTLEDKPYATKYMSVGKPIIGAINGSWANFIINNEIGYACASGDGKELAELLNKLDINELHKIGKHSKEVY